MKQSRLLMGMPITIELVDDSVTAEIFNQPYNFLSYVDETFSPYKETSEVSRINRGELTVADACADMQTIVQLAEQTKRQTDGYFDVMHDGVFNPSGVVKGWAIQQAADMLRALGYANGYVDAGGDVQVFGHNGQGDKWRVGVRNPFDPGGIVKRLNLTDCAVATSGFYNRGQHIYNPHLVADKLASVASITVIGAAICDADRLATAAFAMGINGINFIESLDDFEGYLIDYDGLATMTSGLANFV